MDKARLQELFEAVPVVAPPEALADYLVGQKELVNYLAEKLGQLTTMSLAHKNAIELTANAVFGDDDETSSKLIGFETPGIIIDKVN